MKMEIEHLPRYGKVATIRQITNIYLGRYCVVYISPDVNGNKKDYLFVIMACAYQPDSNDEEEKKIIQHYSDILGFISAMEEGNIDVLMAECGIEEQIYSRCNDKRSKADCILLETVCRGKEDIRRFLEKFEMLLSNNQQLLYEFKNCMRSSGKTVPLDFLKKYKSVTRKSILCLKDCLMAELEIAKVLIPLLEIGVISIDEYRHLNNQMSAVDQRKRLLEFVLNSKEAVKIHRFLYVLHEIGRYDILKALLTRQNSIGTDNLEDFGFELSDTVLVWELPQYPNMVEDEQAIDVIARSDLEFRLVDKWEGSVVLRLQSVLKPEIIFNKREKMEHFLRKMYDDVKMQPGETKRIDLNIRVIPRNRCIVRRKPLGRDVYSSAKFYKTEEEFCLACLQEIVRKNVKVLVAEIESDVISETFNQVGDTSSFVKNMCLSTKTTPSRQQRALFFLKYALHENSFLREFYNIFKKSRSTELEPAQCSTCSMGRSTSGSDCTLGFQEIKLTFILSRENGNNIVRSLEDLLRPIVGPSFITAADDKIQNTETTSRTFGKIETGDGSSTKRNSKPSWEREMPYYLRGSSWPEFGSRMNEFDHLISIISHQSKELEKQSREIVSLKEIMQEESKKTDTIKSSLDLLITKKSRKDSFRGESNAVV